ncbi:hypothetical protein PHMEG_0004518 [Phytophthora megakarya]|uniref:Uncharacterized protein n=1 Tax=Phytophthora megakarya TaxID=4795 RepID=A0A225WVA5_9STRA|nr:hypothetical protein PHMEG_0004518 [Phytophthora megakarya]
MTATNKFSAVVWALFGLETAAFNVSSLVIDTLVVYLLYHYPVLKGINTKGHAVERVEACVTQRAVSVGNLLAWSSYLSSKICPPNTCRPSTTTKIAEYPTFRHPAALIMQLVQVIQMLDMRLTSTESKVCNKRERLYETNTKAMKATPIQNHSDDLEIHLNFLVCSGFVRMKFDRNLDETYAFNHKPDDLGNIDRSFVAAFEKDAAFSFARKSTSRKPRRTTRSTSKKSKQGKREEQAVYCIIRKID